MKCKLFIAVLALSSFAFAQHGGGRPSGAGTGAGSSMGSGMGNTMGHGAGMGSEMGPGMRNPNASMDRGAGGSMMNASGKTAADLLTQNTKLSSNLEKMLPQGMTAQQACDGFKNLGQCVAAIHVSHNLDIPFADLKAKTTGSDSVSLGKAIETLKPAADARSENKKAQKQAKEDLKTS